ncbi:hypothetical protein IWW37_005527 [Coemansia sp. RSA 2050]|nr:hypothetical protein IWW37_005527 [Coemansia sp. RSA 2050]KAJ2729732.1 hypothetical protein IW152_005512 [Coemansia sp. BCRC 34962]
MSYIPKPDAWAARFDNTRSQHTNHPSRHSHKARPTVPTTIAAGHRRQSSIVVLASSDEEQSGLPTPSHALGVDDVSATASSRQRRHRSVSGSAIKEPQVFVEAGTVLQEIDQRQKRAPSDTRPSSAWCRLGMSKIPRSWKIGASRRCSTADTVSQLETRLWTPEETSLLAHVSLGFWMGGRAADLDLVARGLRRPVKDVRMMLQLMLQEYVLHAQKTHWSAEEESLIRQWAAAEFPHCSTLSASADGDSRQSSLDLFSACNCFSLLICRPPLEHKALATVSPDQSAPLVIEDKSAHLNRRAEPQAEHRQQSADESGSRSIKPTAQLSPFGLSSFQDTEPRLSKPSSNRPLFLFGVPQTQSNGSHGLKAEGTQRALASKPKSVNFDFTATAAPRKGVNTVSKNSRSRQLHEMQVRRAKAPASVETRATTSSLVQHVKLPAVQSSHRDDSHSDSSDTGARPVLYDGGDSMTYDPNDTELSPEQSTDTHDFNRLDGDIDMRFFDVPAAARKVIRGFVDFYIERYFDVFFFRATHPSADAHRLCAALREVASAALSDLELLNAAEQEILSFDVFCLCRSDNEAGAAQTDINLDRCSLHFHASLLRAVQGVNIYSSDANWPSADAYATAIYNRAIEDMHYLAFEGRMEAVESRVVPGLAASRHVWFESVGLRISQFKRVYYMGIIASRLTGKYIQGSGRDIFMKRAAMFGYHAVPTATNYDDDLSEEDMARELEDPTTDVSVRGELHSLIMEMAPHATNNSTMIAMQMSVEAYNKAVVEYVESQRGELAGAFAGPATLDLQPIDPLITASIKKAQGALTIDTACALARWVAEQRFDTLKAEALKALMLDHQFRPASLADVRRWIVEDRSPIGKNTEFLLNTSLYGYLKAQRVRMSEIKWLYASAAATLRLIELVKTCAQNRNLLEHVSILGFTTLFKECIAAEAPLAPRQCHVAAPAESERPPMQQVLPKTPGDALVAPLERTSANSSYWTRPNYVGQDMGVSQLEIDKLALRASSGHAPLHGLLVKDSGTYGQYKPQADAPQGLRSGCYNYPSVDISPLTEQSLPSRAPEAAVAFGLAMPGKGALELTAESRLAVLEKELASMRRDIGDVVRMQSNVSEILSLLRGQPGLN